MLTSSFHTTLKTVEIQNGRLSMHDQFGLLGKLTDLDGLENVENPESITEIDLSNENILWIPAGIFDQFENLGVLNLSGNRICYFEQGCFRGLHNLKVINLIGNPMPFFDCELVQDCKDVQVLLYSNFE